VSSIFSNFWDIALILRLEYGKRNTEKERSICKSGKGLVQHMPLPFKSIPRGRKQTPVHDVPVHPSKIPEQKRQVML